LHMDRQVVANRIVWLDMAIIRVLFQLVVKRYSIGSEVVKKLIKSMKSCIQCWKSTMKRSRIYSFLSTLGLKKVSRLENIRSMESMLKI